MKTTNYKEKVKSVIAEKAGVEPNDVLDDMFFGDDLNLGDLELIEILEELEEQLQTELMSQKSDIESVKDLYDLIEERIE